MWIYIAFALSMLVNVLQFVAPLTKNKWDDKALDLAKDAQKLLPPPAPPVLKKEG